MPTVRRNQTGRLCPSVFEVGRGYPQDTGQPTREGQHGGICHRRPPRGGLDIQKLRDWEVDEKHVVLYDNIVALGAGSDSW